MYSTITDTKHIVRYTLDFVVESDGSRRLSKRGPEPFLARCALHLGRGLNILGHPSDLKMFAHKVWTGELATPLDPPLI